MTTTYSNFGPLTTSFTPAASCSSFRNQIYTLAGTVTTIWFRQGGHSDCYPGSVMYGYHYSVGDYSVNNAYFSPAFDCPAGWGTSATLLSSSNAVDEQAYICCPSGFTWSFAECLSTVADQTPMVRNETLDGFTWIEGGYETRSYDPNDANNWPVEIHYRDSDLGASATTTSGAATSSTLSASPGSALGTSSGTQPTTSVTDTGPTSTTSPSTSSGGLSTGAKIAIGVVIPVVVIGLLIGLFFIFRRRRTARKAKEQGSWPGDVKTPELGGRRNDQTPELEGKFEHRPVELGEGRRHSELPGSPGTRRAELEG